MAMHSRRDDNANLVSQVLFLFVALCMIGRNRKGRGKDLTKRGGA
jgi:hypothetical protein